MDYIFIDKKDNIQQVGYVEEDKLLGLYIDDLRTGTLVGNIYRGRVQDLVRGMNAAFVDIGEEKNAYLSLQDALPKDKMYGDKTHDISDVLKSGREIMVQVTRDSFGDKGAKVTTHIELSGRYLIFNPYSNRINVSRKIKNKIRRKRLEDLGSEMMLDDQGMIIRTIAESVDHSKLEEEYDYLYTMYKKLNRELGFLPIPKLIYRDLKDWEEIIRDRDLDKIIINDKSTYQTIGQIEDQYDLDLQDRVIYDREFSLSYDPGLQKQVKNAMAREVYLKSGASIVIDEAEALTAIDVNTKSFTGNLKLSKTVLDTNLEAASEIARQVRLRNIGGIIIVDFIRMKDEKHIEMVIGQLQVEIDKDRTQTDIAGMTRLGLLEMTRKKTRPTLNEVLMRDCTTCKGRGKMNKNIDK